MQKISHFHVHLMEATTTITLVADFGSCVGGVGSDESSLATWKIMIGWLFTKLKPSWKEIIDDKFQAMAFFKEYNFPIYTHSM